MATGVKVLTTMLIYYCMLFIFFVHLPAHMTGDVVFSGGFVNESSVNIDTSTITSVDTSVGNTLNLIDIFWSMLTFDIQGISPTIRFITATIPLLLLALGIYAVIRGI